MLRGSPANALETEPPARFGVGRSGAKLCVCHIASGDLWAGAEAQIASLLGALGLQGEFELSAVLLNEGRLAEELRKLGIEVNIIPESRNGFLSILQKAQVRLGSGKFHILHSHRYKENLLAALLARRCKVPFVVRTVHGAAEPFKGLKLGKQFVLRTMDQFVARFATDRVISVSHDLSGSLERYAGQAKVEVIQNGLDTENVRSDLTRAEAKRRLGLDEQSLVLGYAGRLEPVKRLDLFLRAAQKITLPQARFVIAGEGGEESRLRQMTRDAGLAGHVLFLGHRDDIYDVLRAFDLFVLCSDHEGLPMVLLEALYLGVPVVARRVGGIPEVLVDGSCGVLLDSADPRDLADACVRLLENEPLRQRMGCAGGSRVAEYFSGQQTASQVADLYRSLCVTP